MLSVLLNKYSIHHVSAARPSHDTTSVIPIMKFRYCVWDGTTDNYLARCSRRAPQNLPFPFSIVSPRRLLPKPRVAL